MNLMALMARSRGLLSKKNCFVNFRLESVFISFCLNNVECFSGRASELECAAEF